MCVIVDECAEYLHYVNEGICLLEDNGFTCQYSGFFGELSCGDGNFI